jgi:hypothetical protein
MAYTICSKVRIKRITAANVERPAHGVLKYLPTIKHCTPSRPPALAKAIHLPTKVCVVVVIQRSVNVKLVEELGRILKIQPVINLFSHRISMSLAVLMRLSRSIA